MAEEKQLASQQDVENALGRSLTPEEAARADAILSKASELFRSASGQKFTPGRSEVRVKVNGGRAYLRQSPARVVHSVTTEDGVAVSFDLFKQWLRVPLRSHQFLIVDYEHGGEVPDLVRLTVADVARQVLSIDPNAVSGVSQNNQTAGPFSEQNTYSAWAQGGSTRLSPDDLAVARSFRVKIPTTWVQSS